MSVTIHPLAGFQISLPCLLCAWCARWMHAVDTLCCRCRVESESAWQALWPMVTQNSSKTQFSVRQGAPQDTTTDIQLYGTQVSRLEVYLPLEESRWHLLVGKYVSETCFQKFSKTQ
jgi:hypothetical protein